MPISSPALLPATQYIYGPPDHAVYILGETKRHYQRPANVFYCAGNASQVAWQEALDYVGNTSRDRRSVWVEPGAYKWTRQQGQTYGVLWPTTNGVRLVGDSRTGCVITFTGEAATDIALKLPAIDEGGEIGFLQFVNAGTVCKAVSTTGGGQWSKGWMHDLHFDSFATDIELTLGYWSTYERIRKQAGVDGIEFTPANDATNLNTIIGFYGYNFTGSGLKLRGSRNTLIGCESNAGNAGVGFDLLEGYNYALINCSGDSPQAPLADLRVASGVHGYAKYFFSTAPIINNSAHFEIEGGDQAATPDNNSGLGQACTAVVTKNVGDDLFDAAGTTDNVAIWSQPAYTVLDELRIVLMTKFDTGGATDLDITVGDAVDPDGLLAATMNLTSDTVGTPYRTRGAYWSAATAAGYLNNTASAVAWRAYATSVGANLNALTTNGRVVFYFKYHYM